MPTLNTHFTPIEMATWPRREYFYYFTKLAPMGFTVTVTLDVTATLAWSRAHHVKFNAVYLYLVSRILTDHPEFRVVRDPETEQLVTYDVVHPSYTVIHPDHTISNLWTAYESDFTAFYQNYLADLDQYGAVPGPMPKAPQSPNLFTIGSLPWLDFTSYTPLPFTPLTTYTPVFQAGKFTTHDEQITLPLSLTVHHAVSDGYQASALLNELQAAFRQPEVNLA
ncbi:chloramphenicol acetyltransferase CAT [Levilactobacillus zymae]|uniref:Chloramphenicol acetyltransferase CAT n=1 Tax=Levilactobacillus zymae TaxID=267363 RepID=A0ABQ0WSR4_9LACO|nr:chloramphenicol acetyltransferase [Levilactobacillus zymae]KRL15630.1 chloramphenicol O-acetyltransferase [Levilactobacillus zymae DSM 19395]QFR60704.1 chloramphenicol acetyltransferase CAT [Levilactobacillus zymae]GEO70915.1 chloramphenicol acetyltransferase CAT [Levilactobacillus zymae]